MSGYKSMPEPDSQEYTGNPTGMNLRGSTSDTAATMSSFGMPSVTAMVGKVVGASALHAYGGMPPPESSGAGGSMAPGGAGNGGGKSLSAYGGMPPLGSPPRGVGPALPGGCYGGMPPSRGGGGGVALSAYGGMPPSGASGGGGGGVALSAYGGMPPSGGGKGEVTLQAGGGMPQLGGMPLPTGGGAGVVAGKTYAGMPAPKQGGGYTDMCAPDEVTVAVWKSIAGGSNTAAWPHFVDELQREIEAAFSHNERQLLHAVLGDANRRPLQTVAQRVFSSFVRAFGPSLAELPGRLETLHAHPWFFGAISRQVADAVLKAQANGTFLVRLSASKMGSFDLVVAHEGRSPSHVLLEGLDGSGIRLKFKACEDAEEEIKEFPDISEAIDWYTEKGELAAPYPGGFIRKPYFLGAVGSTASAKMLTGQPAGTFLIRLSSSPGCFTSSFVNSEGKIMHSRISFHSSGRVTEDSSGKTWPGMDAMLEDMKTKGILASPCPGGG